MKVLIIQGSPKRRGHTALITDPVAERLKANGCIVESLWLGDYKVNPCLGCMACQDVSDTYGCVQKDDAEALWGKIAEADLLILATPIYTWYCTAQMKNLLDRHYAVNKFYGKAAKDGKYTLAPNLSLALITTHGYRPETANDLFEEGMIRFCRHCGWKYLGLYSERDLGPGTDFRAEDIKDRAEEFADTLADSLAI